MRSGHKRVHINVYTIGKADGDVYFVPITGDTILIANQENNFMRPNMTVDHPAVKSD